MLAAALFTGSSPSLAPSPCLHVLPPLTRVKGPEGVKSNIYREEKDGVVGHEAKNSEIRKQRGRVNNKISPPSFSLGSWVLTYRERSRTEGYAGNSPPDCEAASWIFSGLV
jgi:hypothetical protein